MKPLKTTFLCDQDCNHCEAINNPQVSLAFNTLLHVYGDGVEAILNTICPNFTCCSDCRIDDFCHIAADDGKRICDIDLESRRLARRFRRDFAGRAAR